MAEKIEYVFPKEDGVALVDGLPRIVDDEAYQKRTEEAMRDDQYFGDHWDELLEKYPDQWVAVFRKEVIAVDSTVKGVYEKVDELGIHRNHTIVHLIETNRLPLIL